MRLLSFSKLLDSFHKIIWPKEYPVTMKVYESCEEVEQARS